MRRGYGFLKLLKDSLHEKIVAYLISKMTASKSFRWVLIVISVCVAILLVLMMSKHSRRAVQFDIQMPSEPVSIDVSLAEDGAAFAVLSAFMNGLMRYNLNHEIENDIAASVVRSDDGLQYTVKLKPWYWSDGKLVTTDDFLFGIERTLNQKTGSKLAYLLFCVRGAKAYHRGQIKTFSKVGIRKITDSEMVFSLDRPCGYFNHLLTLSITFPQRRENLNPETYLSNGRYKIVKWVRDQRVELERNSFFGNSIDSVAMKEKHAKLPKRIVFHFIPEEAAVRSLFTSGMLDVLLRPPLLEVAALREKNLLSEFPYFATYFFAFRLGGVKTSTSSDFTLDRKARLAIASAIDRDKIYKILNIAVKPTFSWVPPDMPGAPSIDGIKFDPDYARTLWAQSNAKGLKTLEFGYDAHSRNQIIVEQLQQQLFDVLGVRLILRSQEWKTYISELTKSPRELFRFGWLSPFIDPYGHLMIFTSDSQTNYTRFRNDRYDRLVKQVAEMPLGAPARSALVTEAQKVLVEEEVVVLPIFHYIFHVAHQTWVTEFRVNGLGAIDFDSLELDLGFGSGR